jgi:chromosome segregation protein
VARFDEELRRLDALMSGAAERLAGRRRQHEAREIELAALDEELARTRDALASAERAATEERAALPERRRAAEDARARREEAEAALGRARGHAATTIQQASELELAARTAEERALSAQLRVEEAEAGIADAHAALEGLEDRRSSLASSRDRATAVAEAAFLVATRAETWAREAGERATSARSSAEEGEHKLTQLIERERDLAERLDQVSQRRNAAEVRQAQARARIDALAERSMEEWGLGVMELRRISRLEAEAEVEAQEEVEKLDRDMRRLGAINPRAAEEYAELAERESFLEGQIEDLKTSRRDLMRIVREVDDEIVQVFMQAYEDVAREFEAVFSRLFPGGSGRLKLTDPEDLLNSGVEVEARPPGKNIRKLSLLSGGERSLVALAFLFAIFRSRPSPFYLLDEVEAALDDINLQRFITLVDELEERAQILVVTHQKRTMEAADVLYGVSMGKDGVSLVVAKRMEDALTQ